MQFYPLIKTGLGYTEEASQAQCRQPPLKAILMQQGAVNSLTIVSKDIK